MGPISMGQLSTVHQKWTPWSSFDVKNGPMRPVSTRGSNSDVTMDVDCCVAHADDRRIAHVDRRLGCGRSSHSACRPLRGDVNRCIEHDDCHTSRHVRQYLEPP